MTFGCIVSQIWPSVQSRSNQVLFEQIATARSEKRNQGDRADLKDVN